MIGLVIKGHFLKGGCSMNSNLIMILVATILIATFCLLLLPKTSLGGTPTLGCCINEDGCIGCGPHEDCSITGIDCPLPPDATFFAGEICLGLGASDDECKTPDGGESGCCVINQGDCNQGPSLEECNVLGGDSWFNDIQCGEVSQCATLPRNVPTLSVWGLITLAGILGLIAFIIIQRRRVSI